MDIFAALIILGIFGVAVAIAQALSGTDRTGDRLRALTLSNVDQMNGVEFEHYAAALLRNEGYANVVVTPASGDNGVDITATLGDRRFAIQAKRYKSTVSRRAVSDAVAGMVPYRCNASMVITTGRLSAKAMQFAAMHNCEVIDRDILADWIGRFHIAPTLEAATPSEPIFNTNASHSIPGGSTSALHTPSIAPSSAPNSGVPLEVLSQIKVKAKADFPSDYSTMEYQINCEIEAYRELQKLVPSDIPHEVLAKITARAAVEHPLDFSTQLYDARDQIESFRALTTLQVKGVPSSILREICTRGEEEYPDDYSTRLYFIREETRAYLAVEAVGRISAA